MWVRKSDYWRFQALYAQLFIISSPPSLPTAAAMSFDRIDYARSLLQHTSSVSICFGLKDRDGERVCVSVCV